MRLVDRVMMFMFGKKRPTPRALPEPHLLDRVCQNYGATYQRTLFPTGEVQITLIRSDATLSAVGVTTADAVQKLATKADACWKSLR
jgi:hypothetical protein